MKELVIFDVDNTIIKGQSQRMFINYLYKNKYISLFCYIWLITWFVLYNFGLTKNPRPAMKYAFSFIKNKSEDEIQIIVDGFFDKILNNKIYPEAKKIIQEHQNNNRQVILLSNAVDILIQKIALHLNVGDYLSTKLEVVQGKYTGNIVGSIIYGRLKKELVENYAKANQISMSDTWAYADHESDIFLLSSTGHPNAVNPSANLRKFAKVQGWPIFNFSL